jgi:hypothetical protein
MKSKAKPPAEFKDINDTVALYVGRYAGWSSSGFKGGMPGQLLELIIKLNKETELFLIRHHGENIV